MSTYNGHANWNQWNVALWLANDEGLYRMACDIIRRRKPRHRGGLDAAAREIVTYLRECGITHTPDGAYYSFTAVRQGLRGLV